MRLLAALAMIAAAVLPCAVTAAPADSLYVLDAPLTRQDATAAKFDVYRGHPTLVSMFYGSCGYVCPALIARIRHLEDGLDAASRARLRVLLVSIDPAHDTPEVLQALAERHHADPQRWTLARAAPSDVRKIAGLLGVQYRELPDGSFNHSVLVTLLDAQGSPLARSAKLSGDDAAFVSALHAATAVSP